MEFVEIINLLLRWHRQGGNRLKCWALISMELWLTINIFSIVIGPSIVSTIKEFRLLKWSKKNISFSSEKIVNIWA